jgi:colicin import membrane protein
LNHGHPGNQHDLENIIGDDAIFKHAYEKLNMDHWSRNEIDMYEQYMQKKTQQDAEGYVTPPGLEFSNTKPIYADLIDSDTPPEGSSDSEIFISTEESSDSEDERIARLELENIEMRRKEEMRKCEMKRKVELEKEQEIKKKAEIRKTEFNKEELNVEFELKKAKLEKEKLKKKMFELKAELKRAELKEQELKKKAELKKNMELKKKVQSFNQLVLLRCVDVA